MSLQSIWTNQLVDVAAQNLVAMQDTIILSSAEIDNSGGNYKNSMRLSYKFFDVIPTINGVGTWWLTAIVEHEVDPGVNRWVTIHRQFSPLRVAGTQALERRLEMQPNFDSFNQGIDEVVAPIDREMLRISREPGALPSGNLRVCVLARDDDAGGPNSLTSFKIDADLELYTV